jgi:hypothetical protein
MNGVQKPDQELTGVAFVPDPEPFVGFKTDRL